MEKTNQERFFNYLMLAGLLMIFFAVGLCIGEFLVARNFCNSIDGNYSFKVFSDQHYFCNDIEIVRYTDGWSYRREEIPINWSSINLSIHP